MRLFELIDSNHELLDIIKPILLRAKAEGADSIDMHQLLNDLDSRDNITPQIMIDVLNKNREQLKNIVNNATIDTISLNTGPESSMTTKHDNDAEKIKNTAVKQAVAGLNQ
jgi:hypothetical protein